MDRDIAKGEVAEEQLSKFISVRHERRAREEGEWAEEAAWKESVRRYYAARSRDLNAQWYEYHTAQARRFKAAMDHLVGFHEAQAEKYRSAI